MQSHPMPSVTKILSLHVANVQSSKSLDAARRGRVIGGEGRDVRMESSSSLRVVGGEATQVGVSFATYQSFSPEIQMAVLLTTAPAGGP